MIRCMLSIAEQKVIASVSQVHVKAICQREQFLHETLVSADLQDSSAEIDILGAQHKVPAKGNKPDRKLSIKDS